MSRRRYDPASDVVAELLAALDDDPVGALLELESADRVEALIHGYDTGRPGTIRNLRQIVFVGSAGRGIR